MIPGRGGLRLLRAATVAAGAPVRAGVLRITVGALLAVPVTLGVAGAAEAHNVLLNTDPVDGSTVATVPASVVLTFNGPSVGIGTELAVTGPGGGTVSTGPAVLAGNTVRQAIRGGAPAGHYTVLWRVTSLDGHPVSGTFTFTASSASAGAPAASGPVATVRPSAPAGQGRNLLPIVLLGSVVLLFVLAVAVVIAVQTRRDRELHVSSESIS